MIDSFEKVWEKIDGDSKPYEGILNSNSQQIIVRFAFE
jgi:hypothetical protein